MTSLRATTTLLLVCFSASGIAQSASAAVSSAASDADLTRAVTTAFAQAPNVALLLSSGLGRMTDSTISTGSPLMGATIAFAVRNSHCVKAAAGRLSCNYEYQYGARQSTLGMQVPVRIANWARRSDTLRLENGVLRSATLDAAMNGVAQSLKAPPGPNNALSLADQFRQQRHEQCNQSIMSSLMAGDTGTAAVTGIAGC